jgi:enoyl-[acyl-carrier protein] reductase III
VEHDYRYENTNWALILGASSGFGGATAVELARHGMNICGVHFDRSTTVANAVKVKTEVESYGVKTMFFNVNAADPSKRAEVIAAIEKEFRSDSKCNVKVLLHSLAFGTLRPLISTNDKDQMTQAQITMTFDIMANSLVYWTQAAFNRKLLKSGAHIYSMTSSGWHSQLSNYGAVSAAKAALVSYTKQLCVELGPYGITANAIMAGVTDTASLRKIPGAMKMIDLARSKNPAMRNTTPNDVAKAISLLSHDDASFISGNTIGVDGGEDVSQYIGQKNMLDFM